MIAIVRNSVMPRITWLGGVCAVPKACLVIARTMAILVKHVALIKSAGINTKTVINPMIFNAVVICPFAVADAAVGRFRLISGEEFWAKAAVGSMILAASIEAIITSKYVLEFCSVAMALLIILLPKDNCRQ